VIKNKIGITKKFIKLKLNGWKLKTVVAPSKKGEKNTKKKRLLRKFKNMITIN